MSPGWNPHMNRISGRTISTINRLMAMLTTSAELVERRLVELKLAASQRPTEVSAKAPSSPIARDDRKPIYMVDSTAPVTTIWIDDEDAQGRYSRAARRRW